jgi:hypothetical protein
MQERCFRNAFEQPIHDTAQCVSSAISRSAAFAPAPGDMETVAAILALIVAAALLTYGVIAGRSTIR